MLGWNIISLMTLDNLIKGFLHIFLFITFSVQGTLLIPFVFFTPPFQMRTPVVMVTYLLVLLMTWRGKEKLMNVWMFLACKRPFLISCAGTLNLNIRLSEILSTSLTQKGIQSLWKYDDIFLCNDFADSSKNPFP